MDDHMGAWATGIVGLGIGAAIAWIIAQSRTRAELARAEALAAQTAAQAQVELARVEHALGRYVITINVGLVDKVDAA